MAEFRDRLVFDLDNGELRDGELRYLMLRADALMGLFKQLPEDARQAALASLGRSVLTHGGNSARTYLERSGADPSSLCAIISGTAPQLGWGVWRFGPDQADALTLEVTNSPFVAGYGTSSHPLCAPIVGMLEAVGGLVLSGPVTAEETGCAAVTGGEACHFTVKRTAS
jgi:predicted hydrocarbon binding protein